MENPGLCKSPIIDVLSPSKNWNSSEPEEQDAVECKVEEQTYASPNSSVSPAHSPVDHTLNPLYPLAPANIGSSFGYSRAGDRQWQGAVETTARAGTPSIRGQEIWPLSSTSSHPHIGSSRRESAGLTQSDSWTGSGLQSGNGHSLAFMSWTDIFIERSRIRSSNPYQNAVALRDHDSLSGLSTRYHGSRSRDMGSQRLPWMMNSDSSDRETRSSHSRSSYASSSLPFGEGYQSYGSSWSGNDSGIDISPTQASFSPTHQYASSYTSGSGKTSSLVIWSFFWPSGTTD